jgi:hypothetical protein
VTRRSGIPLLQEQILEVLGRRASTPAQILKDLGCKRTSFHVAVSELERRGTITATGHGPNRVLCHPTLFSGLVDERLATVMRERDAEAAKARGELAVLRGRIHELEEDLQELVDTWPGLENCAEVIPWAYDCDELGTAEWLCPSLESWCTDCEVCDG